MAAFLSSTDGHSIITKRLIFNATGIDMDGKVHREAFWGEKSPCELQRERQTRGNRCFSTAGRHMGLWVNPRVEMGFEQQYFH